MIRIPHLETDVTRACQLSCVACNHHVPLWRVQPGGAPKTSPAQVRADLDALAKILHADAWGALGGEPTLHPELVKILEAVHASGVADVVEVWTNGIRIAQMTDGFWTLVDRLVVSRYEDKLTDDQVKMIRLECDVHEVELRIMDERASPNFKTLFEPAPTDAARTREKYAGCFFRHFSRVANDGYFYTCCCAPHMPVLMQNRPVGSDGVKIEGLTEAGLRDYLASEEPLGACTMCAGRDTAVSIQWSEERQPIHWIRKSGLSAGDVKERAR